MTKIELTTEHDLWRLFGGNGPETSGDRVLEYKEVWDRTSILDIASRGYRPKFKMTDSSRFYRLSCDNIDAVVNQACLHTMAKKIGIPELRVAYIGTAPIGFASSD